MKQVVNRNGDQITRWTWGDYWRVLGLMVGTILSFLMVMKWFGFSPADVREREGRLVRMEARIDAVDYKLDRVRSKVDRLLEEHGK